MEIKNKNILDPNTPLKPVAFLKDTSGIKFIVETTEKPIRFAFLLPPQYNFIRWYLKFEVQKAIFEYGYKIFEKPQNSFKYQDREEYLTKLSKKIMQSFN